MCLYVYIVGGACTIHYYMRSGQNSWISGHFSGTSISSLGGTLRGLSFALFVAHMFFSMKYNDVSQCVFSIEQFSRLYLKHLVHFQYHQMASRRYVWPCFQDIASGIGTPLPRSLGSRTFAAGVSTAKKQNACKQHVFDSARYGNYMTCSINFGFPSLVLVFPFMSTISLSYSKVPACWFLSLSHISKIDTYCYSID